MEKGAGTDKIYIEVITIGNIHKEIARHVLEVIDSKFKYLSKPGKSLALPVAAFDDRRGQYNASILLSIIGDSKSIGATKSLGIVGEDIFSRGLNYVFGQAVLGGCCAVVSLSRLREGTDSSGGKELFLDRVEKEVVHELGHTFGLRHCPNPKCVMYFSSNIADTDKKSADFCEECGYPSSQF